MPVTEQNNIQSDCYYTCEELKNLGIKFGKNVLISKKTSLYCNQLSLGSNIRIDDFCILTGDIQIGSYVHIASYCQLSGGCGIIIEDFSGIASRSLLFSQTDDFSGEYMTGPLINDSFRKVKKGKIIVKKHSIVGAGSIILPQVILNEGTAIGAFTLVCSDTEAWSLNTGIPSKKIKDRKKNIIELEKKFLKTDSL